MESAERKSEQQWETPEPKQERKCGTEKKLERKKNTVRKRENLRARGAKYERIAAAFLVQQNYRLLRQNYCCRGGEIDLIALDGRTLCFIEVKYRKNAACGFPGEAVDARKRARIICAARQFLYELPKMRDAEEKNRRETGERTAIRFDSLRFDVVEILGDKIRVIQNAFELSL